MPINFQSTLKKSGSKLTSNFKLGDKSVIKETTPEVLTASLSILLVDEDAERMGQIATTLETDATVQQSQICYGTSLLEQVIETHPDILILACANPNEQTIESLKQLSDAHPIPILMFVDSEGETQMAAALEAGVSAYVIDGLTPHRVRPLIETTLTRFKIMEGLKVELQKAKDDLAARKAIERAKGLLMSRQGITEEQAFKAIRDMSQQQRKPMKDVAGNVIAVLELINPQS